MSGQGRRRRGSDEALVAAVIETAEQRALKLGAERGEPVGRREAMALVLEELRRELEREGRSWP